MRAFLRDTLLLVYFGLFRESALAGLFTDPGAPSKDPRTFFHISTEVGQSARARRALASCLLVWLVGLVPFWCLFAGNGPWWAAVLISVGLMLAAWGTAVLKLACGLALPLWAGLVWGLDGRLWQAVHSGLFPALGRLFPAPAVAGLAASAVLSAGGAALLAHRKKQGLAGCLAALLTLVSLVLVAVLYIRMPGGWTALGEEALAFFVMLGLAAVLAAGMWPGAGRFVGIFLAFSAAAVAAAYRAGIAPDPSLSSGAGFALLLALLCGALLTAGVAGVSAFCINWAAAESAKGPATTTAVGILLMYASPLVGLAIAIAVFPPLYALALLPLPWVLVPVLLLGLALSPIGTARYGLIPAGILAVILLGVQGWRASLAGGLACLVGYFRVPIYIVEVVISAIASARLRTGRSDPRRLARWVPPAADEVMWFPLPGRAQIVAAARAEDAARGAGPAGVMAEPPTQGPGEKETVSGTGPVAAAVPAKSHALVWFRIRSGLAAMSHRLGPRLKSGILTLVEQSTGCAWKLCWPLLVFLLIAGRFYYKSWKGMLFMPLLWVVATLLGGISGAVPVLGQVLFWLGFQKLVAPFLLRILGLAVNPVVGMVTWWGVAASLLYSFVMISGELGLREFRRLPGVRVRPLVRGLRRLVGCLGRIAKRAAVALHCLVAFASGWFARAWIDMVSAVASYVQARRRMAYGRRAYRLWVKAAVCWVKFRPDRASEICREAALLAERGGHDTLLAILSLYAGERCFARGEFDEARKWHRRADEALQRFSGGSATEPRLIQLGLALELLGSDEAQHEWWHRLHGKQLGGEETEAPLEVPEPAVPVTEHQQPDDPDAGG